MRLSIGQQVLQLGVSVVSKAISRNASTPMLGGMLMTANDGIVTLQGTDGNSSIRHLMHAVVDEPGETVVSGRLMADIVKGLRDAPVDMELNGDVMNIKCGRSKYALHTLDPSLFPAFPDVEPEQSVELDTHVVAAMAERAHKAASRDPSRAILTGVLVTVGDGTLRMVATDSYRLLVCETPADEGLEFSATVPGASLHQALSMPTLGQTVTIGASEYQVVFTSGMTTMITRKLEGEFPSWNKLFPASHEVDAYVDAEEMLGAIRRASVVASTNPVIAMEFAGDTLTVRGNSPDHGESTEVVAADVKGHDVLIGLNHHYIADGIDASAGELHVELTGGAQPAVIRSQSGEMGITYLLMPARI